MNAAPTGAPQHTRRGYDRSTCRGSRRRAGAGAARGGVRRRLHGRGAVERRLRERGKQNDSDGWRQLPAGAHLRCLQGMEGPTEDPDRSCRRRCHRSTVKLLWGAIAVDVEF